MRIRIQGSPPLPFFKAWYCPQNDNTILDLKTSICDVLPPLRDSSIAANEISLLLDDFELFDNIQLDAVRDGDLIVVKKCITQSHKRKADHVDEQLRTKRRKTARATSPSRVTVAQSKSPQKKPKAVIKPDVDSSSSESESSSSDSSSDSDSSESSEDSSDSDSSDEESSSESDSDSDSPPDTAPSKPAQANTASNITKQATENLVPPGFGKSTTRSRNLRRRRKKEYEKLAKDSDPTNVNETPLGQKKLIPVQPNGDSTATSQPPAPDYEPAPVIMMASLSNKNKRRGFKSAMNNTAPTKILFDDDASAAGGSGGPDVLPFSETTTSEMTKAAPTGRPRLIPPSEKQEKGLLPPNMFVTSVDVEEGMWPQKRKKKKARVPSVEAEAEYLDYGVAEEAEVDELISTQRTVEPSKSSGGEMFIKDIEKRWDQLVKVTEQSQVTVGTSLAWKELGINASTFTPEMLQKIGTVTNVTVDSIELEQQPDFTPAFGGVILDEREEPESISVTVGWSDIITGDYRVSHGV